MPGSAEDSGSDSGSDSDSNSDASSEEEAPLPKKRKAEADATPAAVKKSKSDNELSNGDGSSKGNLFIGNLSWNVDEEWLQREFEKFGEIKGVRIMSDKNTGRSRG